ncbi:polysaccharide deacetylase family protein [Patescibacteria group bacterium]|nr:polysaccharide deacetylase family protein [Patescibacteria group bacterium]
MKSLKPNFIAGLLFGLVITFISLYFISPRLISAGKELEKQYISPYLSLPYTNNVERDAIIKKIAPYVIPTDSLKQTTDSTTEKINPNDYCVNVPVLMYHHIQPESLAKEKGQTALTVDSGVFDQQMAYLVSQGYTSISAEQLANDLKNRSGLPSKPIVITMDDGYKDNFTYGFPIIQKYGLTANIMIATGLMENPDWLSWNDLKSMVDSGRFYAYNHTWSHISLAGASEDKVRSEIQTASKQLQDHLGRSGNIFTYPYGSQNQRVIDILTQDGFTAAFSTIPGRMQCQSFIYALHRTRVGNGSLAYYGI